MKNTFLTLVTLLFVGFGSAQETNLSELTEGHEDIVVKLNKRVIGNKYTMRVNNDRQRDAQEDRIYFDNRLKLNKNRHVVYFENLEDANKFLSRNGYNLNLSKFAYWDHPDGTKNYNEGRNGTAKIGDIATEPNYMRTSKTVYVFSKGGSYTAFPSACKTKAKSSSCKTKASCKTSKKSCDTKKSCDSKKTTCASSLKSCAVAENKFHSVYFSTDDYKKIKITEVAKVANYLKENADKKVCIVGNTDIRGTKDYNQKLGKNRADECADLLVKQYGINRSRITTSSNGELKPLYQGFDQNRRVDFFVK
ncbi:MAG: OmpA family protein [Flavobacteriales bacterium]|nr:OmpA family protein [Flavobacteriales bacterium]